MDPSTVVISTTCVAASTPVAMAAVKSYRALAAPRFVTCPETAAEAIVKIRVARAIASLVAGGGPPRLSSCSRWPEKKGCGQACAVQIAGSHDGCRSRATSSPSRSSPPAWTSERFAGMK